MKCSTSSVTFSWSFIIFLFSAFFSNNSDHLTEIRLFCSALTFLGLVSLEVTRTGSFLLSFKFFKDTTLGRWSLTSPLSKLPSHDWLMKILSINVAVLFVILVGLVIIGTRFNERFAVKNLSVRACFDDLSRSKLWSRPIIIPFWSFFQTTDKAAVLIYKVISRGVGGSVDRAHYDFLAI